MRDELIRVNQAEDLFVPKAPESHQQEHGDPGAGQLKLFMPSNFVNA